MNDNTRDSLREIKLVEGSIRGLSPFEMKFDYPIAAIAGRNGAGKSTLLAIAACAFHNHDSGFRLQSRGHSYYTFSDFFVQHASEATPEGINIQYWIASRQWADEPENGPGRLAHQVRVKPKGGRWNNYERRVHRTVVYLGIERIVPHVEKSQSRSYSHTFTVAKAAGWEARVRAAVGKVLDKEYQSFEYATHSRYRLPVVKQDGVSYSGFNMGAGENALFELFSTIYACGEGALVVVDEIELGLHAFAQQRFINQLKEACLEVKCQIICTTHSKEILSQLPPDARFFVERISGKTRLTNKISPEFAFAKMSGENSGELLIFVEDGVASQILIAALSLEIRKRVTIKAIGSASAVARQLAAAYLEDRDGEVMAVFDGDQTTLEQANLNHAKDMVEAPGDDFDRWFEDRVAYLPGDSWPERWLIDRCAESANGLAALVDATVGETADALAAARLSSKHKEIGTLADLLYTDQDDLLRFVCRHVARTFSPDFEPTRELVKSRLGSE